MPTPMHVYDEIAARFGVDGTDPEAVTRFLAVWHDSASQNSWQRIASAKITTWTPRTWLPDKNISEHWCCTVRTSRKRETR